MTTKSDPASLTDLPGFWDRVERVESLEACVLANGPRGSELVKAFALFKGLGEVDLNREEDVVRLWSATLAAEREWKRLSAIEQKRILGGWHPANDLPAAAAFIEDLAGYSDNMLRWMLAANEDGDGNVGFLAAPELVHSTSRVQVAIMQGTGKAEALRQLRNIVQAVEESWERAIGLEGVRGLTWQRPAEEAVQGAAKAAAGLLPAGTLIQDGDDSGVIVGAFKGASNSVYVYVQPDGEVNCQFGNAVKVAKGQRGGFPKVVDGQGRDPLAALRARAGGDKSTALKV